MKIEKLAIAYKLPVEPTFLEMQYLNNVVKLKAYIKENMIVFIICVPLVELEPYTYYRLYSLPIHVNNSNFKQITPSSKFVAISEQKYFTSNNRCYELKPNGYICDQMETKMVDANAMCEVQLLTYSNKYENCIQSLEKFETTQTVKLADNKWLMVFPTATNIHKRCHDEQEVEKVQGTYILTLTNECMVKFDSNLLRTYESSRSIRIPKLPQLPEDHTIESSTNHYSKINKIQEIHKSNISTIQENLRNLKKKISAIDDVQIHERPITIWSIMALILICLIIIYKLIRCMYNRRSTPIKIQEEADSNVNRRGKHPLSLNPQEDVSN